MTDRLRVLWVSPKLPFPLVSGDKIRQYNLLRRLSTRHEVHLLSFLERQEDGEHVAALQKFCDRVTVVPLSPRQPFARRALATLHPWTPFYVRRYESRPFRRVLAAALTERSYDIIQVEHVYMAPYFDTIAPVTSAARVLTLHNSESALAARCAAVEANPLKRVYWRQEARKLKMLERTWLPRVDAAVAVSEKDLRAARGLAQGARVFVVENGVDTDEYEVAPDADRGRTVVFTGSLGYQPNADGVVFFLSNVWPRIRQAVPDAVLQIVGRNPSPTLVARGGLDGVIVTGWVPDVRPYLNRAGVVVVPLRAGGGTRLKILEAMATGNAIVSTRVGAEGLHVCDGRELVLADEPDAFARATVELMLNGERRLRLGRAARRLAETRYDWRFAAAAMEEVYQVATGHQQVASMNGRRLR